MKRQLEGSVPLVHSKNFIYGSNELLPTIDTSKTDNDLRIKPQGCLNFGLDIPL